MLRTLPANGREGACPCEMLPSVPATGKPLSMESYPSAGTHDRLIELLAPKQQQPTMLQGAPGPLPAQLLALLVQQQRLQQLGQSSQQQPGGAAAVGGPAMDATNTGAQKSQEDLALERLAAQLEQCRKTTAQQAGAAK